MKLPLHVVDAFAQRVFEGNPAAVCPLPHWLPDETLAAIAAENNLSETAFVVRVDGGHEIRWFTPTAEVDLCGHATLASAFVLAERKEATWPLVLLTRQVGTLTVHRTDAGFMLDFPARPSTPARPPAELAKALGAAVVSFERASKAVAELASADVVRGLRPDLAYITAMQGDGLIVTAAADEDGVDFVSRYFAPHIGIDEDPVTGSAHCTLAPYWAARLGKQELVAHQVSARGGRLRCVLQGERVHLHGQAVAYLRGEIEI